MAKKPTAKKPIAKTQSKKSNSVRDGHTRRSPCPVACSLDIFGDKWTLLVIRDLLLGCTRFKEMAASPESPPTNVLTDRLNRLVETGIVVKTASADGSRHLAYRLTEKGLALSPLVEKIRDWGLRWEPGTEASRKPVCRR